MDINTILLICVLIFTFFNALMLFCSGCVVLKIAKISKEKQKQAETQSEQIAKDFGKMFGINLGGGDDETDSN